jgi:hypothetical protein
MDVLPAKPAARDFTVINLVSPVGDKEYREELAAICRQLVTLMLAKTKDKKHIHAALRHQLSAIVARQIHGEDGGIFVDTICNNEGGDVRLKKFNGAPVVNPKESVLICHKDPSASSMHIDMLKELIEKGANSNPLTVIDLGVTIAAEMQNLLRQACEKMSFSFNEQKITTVGVASFDQHDGHDDFSMLASIVVAVGYDWTQAELNQYGARVSRPFTKVGADDVVPVKYAAYLFDSPFAKQVNSIDNSKLSSEIQIANYPAVASALKDLETEFQFSNVEMESFKIPAKKLLYADTFLQTKSRLALDYIDKIHTLHTVSGVSNRRCPRPCRVS